MAKATLNKHLNCAKKTSDLGCRLSIETDDFDTALEPARSMVFNMEDDVVALGNYARALSIIGETMSERDGMVTCQLAGDILSRLDAIETSRCQLFRQLHPNRAEFEKSGWPDDADVVSN